MPALLAGCGARSAPPQRTAAPHAPAVPLSTLSATLVVPAPQLARLLGNATEYQIADLKDKPVKCGPLSCRLNLHASRQGPLSVTAEGDSLGINIPFNAKAALSTSGLFSFLHGQADGTGVIHTQTGVTISPDLAIHTRTTGSVQLDNGHLRIGPVVTNIAQIWNENEESLSQPLWRAIDGQVARLPVKQRLRTFWSDAFKPIHAGKSPASWLVMRPERLELAGPHMRNGAMALSLALLGHAQVVVQDTAPENVPTPLDHAEILQSPRDGFSLAVPVLLPYSHASQLALASLQKKPPKIKGATVTFSRLEFLPSGQDVIVATHFCADPTWDWPGWFSSCGDIYLRGVPVFDAAQKAIRVDGLHLDIGSAGLVLRLIGALGQDQLTQLLKSHLVFHEAGPIDRLESQITQLLAKPQGHDVSISAQVETFGTPTFTWTNEGFWALFTAKGKMTATLNL